MLLNAGIDYADMHVYRIREVGHREPMRTRIVAEASPHSGKSRSVPAASPSSSGRPRCRHRPRAPTQLDMSSVHMPPGKALVLFDGVCLLCNGFVHFVIDHEQAPPQDTGITGDLSSVSASAGAVQEVTFRHAFATLQSEEGMSYLTAAGLPLDVSTVVLIDEDGVHTRSTAALRVLKHCGLPYSLMHSVFIWVPAPLRDLGYKAVAAVRYRFFGKDEGESTCRMMTKSLRPRFKVAKYEQRDKAE